MNWEYRMGLSDVLDINMQLWNLIKGKKFICKINLFVLSERNLSFKDTHTHTHVIKSDVNINTQWVQWMIKLETEKETEMIFFYYCGISKWNMN